MSRETTANARRWRVDVNTGTTAAPVWTQVLGTMEMAPPKVEPVIQTSSDYEDEGWEGNEVTGHKWSMELSVRRKRSATGAYDAGQEALRTKKLLSGAEANAQIRVYERAGGAGTEAYQGTAAVGWEDDKGKSEDLASAAISLTGTGPLTVIDNPVTTP